MATKMSQFTLFLKSMQNKTIHCKSCDKIVPKEIVALNKKMFENASKQGEYFCLSCMAAYIECSEQDLLEKIAQFKAAGCKLFQ